MDDYTEKRDLMFERTHSTYAPWIIVRGNASAGVRLLGSAATARPSRRR